MAFQERIMELINKKNTTRSKMLKDLEINHNAFAKWSKPDAFPDAKNLIKIANYFNVSADFLLGLPMQGLAQDEQKLVEDYRELNDQGKEWIRQNMATGLHAYKKPATFPNVESAVGGNIIA
ncbi:MAG: helix-turn-helix domain-containing protein [Oscillospiraceae bacterium]|nr:helix-turn-helix domain-containing protein [Oscillospiraceae bacterium]MCL2278143.1 helix-turn-helix domain-containing protein [Oscillospiraceae bacterium]